MVDLLYIMFFGQVFMGWKNENDRYIRWLSEEQFNEETRFIRRAFAPFVVEKVEKGDGKITLTRRDKRVVKGVWEAFYGKYK